MKSPAHCGTLSPSVVNSLQHGFLNRRSKILDTVRVILKPLQNTERDMELDTGTNPIVRILRDNSPGFPGCGGPALCSSEFVLCHLNGVMPRI